MFNNLETTLSFLAKADCVLRFFTDFIGTYNQFFFPLRSIKEFTCPNFTDLFAFVLPVFLLEMISLGMAG